MSQLERMRSIWAMRYCIKHIRPNYLDHEAAKNNRIIKQYYVESSHPAIIDAETWKLVQEKIGA